MSYDANWRVRDAQVFGMQPPAELDPSKARTAPPAHKLNVGFCEQEWAELATNGLGTP